MKKETKQFRAKVVNDTLFYIYKHIDIDISLDELSEFNSLSKFHFHRIFKEETGKNVFETITSIRLQKAANLLIVNKYSTISEIANECGYSSHSSFIKAFKNKFNYSPTAWKKEGYKIYSSKIINKLPSKQITKNLSCIIKICDPIKCIYIRHKGYDKNIKNSWEKLQALSYEFNIKSKRQIALQHDNPTLTPIEEASYVACLEVEKNFKDKKISTLTIPKSLCAVFSLKGKYGDLLSLMRYVYHYWLPNSGYEAKTLPSYSIYRKNHFLLDNDEFDLDFYLPISVIY